MDEANAAWSEAMQYDPLAAAADHDLGSLIDFDQLDDLDFNIDSYTKQAHHDHEGAQQVPDLSGALHVQHFQNQFSSSVPPETHQNQDGMDRSAMSQAENSFFSFTMPAFAHPGPSQFSAAPGQTFPPGRVPPTPNSAEMHSDTARYLQHMESQARAMFEHSYQLRQGDHAAFTPLVSPAVTPHEPQLQPPSFTMPGVYFSPLTSPALEAQNRHHQHQHLQMLSQLTTPGSSSGASPVDMDVDIIGEAAVPQTDSARKVRGRKPNVQRSANRARQSPIVKPSTRRKSTLSSGIPPKEVTSLIQEAHNSTPTTSSNNPPSRYARDSSGTDSISPEPLTEMGPPPKPSSVSHSPAIIAKGNKYSGPSKTTSQEVCPATPASLMRLQTSPHFVGRPDMVPLLEDFTLPEAASVETQPSSDQTTPHVTARKTPKLGPLSTPSAGAALQGKASPMLSAVNSPISPAFASGVTKKGDVKSSRALKKRQSSISTLASPALRPKISPSIKPLLPEAVNDETHALLLASKSNYQNILDGTTVPGLSYPTSLSTDLTSKRTSHKLAEQGRRNRINTALQEMQALLPSPTINAKDAKSPDASGAGSIAQQQNSKAAKVESAIEYIKQLKKQCSERDALLVEKDQQMEKLRKELAALKSRMESPEIRAKRTPSGELKDTTEKVEIVPPACNPSEENKLEQKAKESHSSGSPNANEGESLTPTGTPPSEKAGENDT